MPLSQRRSIMLLMNLSQLLQSLILSLIGSLKKWESSAKTAGRLVTRTSLYQKTMIEAVIPAVIAVVTGGGVLFNRVHNRIHDLDRRLDGVELRMVETYVSKSDFNVMVDKMEKHLIRIEDKMDQMMSSR